MRLKPWNQWIPVERLLEKWQESKLEIHNLIESKISHPDLSLTNIILSQDEKIYIIDNELNKLLHISEVPENPEEKVFKTNEY